MAPKKQQQAGGFPKKQQKPETESDEEFDSDEEFSDDDEEESEEFDLVGAMNAMPTAQRKRVYGLKALVAKTRAFNRAKNETLAALELSFLKQVEPLMEKRREIVNGRHEPSAAEVKLGVDPTESKVEEIVDSDEEAEKKPKRKGVTVQAPKEEDAKELMKLAGQQADGGIPGFWLTAIKNNEVLESMVNPRDEDALLKLTDVVCSYPENNARKGFALTFHFAENKYFTNKTVTKTYLMDEEEEDEDVLDKAVASDIDWTSPENKLTVIIKQKKQRHKSGKGIRVVQKEEKCPSFFGFFYPPTEEDEDEDEMLEMDYECGIAFHRSLVPRAVHSFTGENIVEMAAQMGMGQFGGDSDDEDGDEEYDDEEEEEEDEEEEDAAPAKKGGKKGGKGGKQEQPECKQQ
jgi:nucleosome assembly protein 1-like 1